MQFWTQSTEIVNERQVINATSRAVFLQSIFVYFFLYLCLSLSLFLSLDYLFVSLLIHNALVSDISKRWREAHKKRLVYSIGFGHKQNNTIPLGYALWGGSAKYKLHVAIFKITILAEWEKKIKPHRICQLLPNRIAFLMNIILNVISGFILLTLCATQFLCLF